MILCPVFTNFHFHEKKKFPCRNEEWRERLKEKWHRPEMSCKTKQHMITKLLWIKLHWFDSQRVWVGVYAVVLSLFYSKMQMQNVANNTNLLLCGVFFYFLFFYEDFTVLRIACMPVCLKREMWIQSWLCLSLSEKTVHCIWIQFVLKQWKVTHGLIHTDCSCSDCVKSFQCKKKL